MDNIKRIPVGLVWLIVIVIGAIFCFYWFSVRPANIRKECQRLVEERYPNYNYDVCLRDKGL